MLRVEHLLPDARRRLFVIRDSAALIEAAVLMRDHDRDLVVVCDPSGRMAGVVTKSDVVRQTSHCCRVALKYENRSSAISVG